jgi:hypothetical protein
MVASRTMHAMAGTTAPVLIFPDLLAETPLVQCRGGERVGELVSPGGAPSLFQTRQHDSQNRDENLQHDDKAEKDGCD